MFKASKSTPGWAVFEDEPLNGREFGLSLREAFHSIMSHCAYAPLWDQDESRVRLRFRYLDGPFVGKLVGDTHPGPDTVTYEEPLTFGVFVARDQVMKRVLDAGMRGWYGARMGEFTVDRMRAEKDARDEAHRHGVV